MTTNNKGDKTKVNEDGTLESHFTIDANEMLAKLNAVSPTLCLAKWKQVTLNLTTGHSNSCYHPSPHKIQTDLLEKDPAALHNTPQKVTRRIEMLEGVQHPECSYCWNIEKDGNLSDRAYRSGEPWAASSFDECVNGSTVDVTPSYVEVNFNSACNLACSYCSPQYSTTWMKEAKEHGAYPTVNPHNDPAYFTGDRMPIKHSQYNPYVEAFWNWWPDLYPELKHFRMTGGEPLMDRNTYKVFDYVLENPKPDLHLDVTSNFSVEPKYFDKYMDYVTRLCEGENIEHFMQYVSVDTWGDQAEYIRGGLNFDRLLSNVERFLTEAPYRNSVTFIITMNMLSIPKVHDLLHQILVLRANHSDTYQRVWFDTPLLRQPDWMSLQVAPESMRRKLGMTTAWMKILLEREDDRFHGFKDYEIQRMERNMDWMHNHNIPRREMLRRKADFYKFFTEYDLRRGTNFMDTFPELVDFYSQCEYQASKI